MAHMRIPWVMAGCALLCWHGSARAQTVYKWTDDQGTVHFADSPPVNTKNVEERNLPPSAPPPAPPPTPVNDQAQPAESKPAGAEGPAHIVLLSKRAPRIGPSAVHVSGKVKNVGGADARDVSITVTAVDSTAGTPCLHQDVSVTPSTLGPGETGKFDAEIDDPCLAGGTPLNIATSSE
jgi:hypothetical protein